MPESPFALFVSSVPGHLVSRYGSGGARAAEPLGAERDAQGVVTWHPEQVLALSHAELARFGREYRRALARGSLSARTEAEYRAFVAAQDAPPIASTEPPTTGEE